MSRKLAGMGGSKKSSKPDPAYAKLDAEMVKDEIRAKARKELGAYAGYKQRDNWLYELGFKDYRDYLYSPMWRIIREEIFIRDAHKCQAKGCSNKAYAVHHLAYTLQTLIGYSTGMLVSFCKFCHTKCEFYPNGKKIKPIDARNKAFYLLTLLKKTKGSSNDRVGLWFKERLNDPLNQEVALKIKERLLQTPGLHTKIMKDWPCLDRTKTKLWEAPPISQEQAKLLAAVIRKNYPKFVVISVMPYQYSWRVFVVGPGGHNKIWTENQIKELQDRFIAGYKRRAR